MKKPTANELRMAKRVFTVFKRLCKSPLYPGVDKLPEKFKWASTWNQQVCITFAKWHLAEIRKLK